MVASHLPLAAQTDISTALPEINIEFSAVIPATTPLSNYIRIYRGGVLANPDGTYAMGEDVTANFTSTFTQLNNKPDYRSVRLTPTAALLPGTEYVVVIKAGLAPQLAMR